MHFGTADTDTGRRPRGEVRIKRLLCDFFLIFFCFVPNCLAYEIKPVYENSAPYTPTALNLVFCPLNYQNEVDFSKDAEALAQRLRATKPFDEFVPALRFYSVVMTDEEAKVFFKKSQDFPGLKVRQDFLEDISKRISAPFKMVIIDAGATDLRFRAELSSIDKMSLMILGKAGARDEESLGRLFLHELGHSLGLRDESPGEHALKSPPGYPNCATTLEEAKAWWGDLKGKEANVGFIDGCCGNKGYIRPTIASLMNDTEKADSFGPVNQRYLGKLLQGRSRQKA